MGQKQLRVTRMRYHPEMSEQVQRHRTGHDRRSVHGLGPRTTGSVSGHTNGWAGQQPTLPAQFRQRLKTPAWANRALWLTGRDVDGGHTWGWSGPLELLVHSRPWHGWSWPPAHDWDNLTICGDYTVMRTMQKRYSKLGSPYWGELPWRFLSLSPKKKRAIFNLSQKYDFYLEFF